MVACVCATRLVSEVRRHFDELVFETIVHRNTRISEAPSVGKPVILYDALSKGSGELFKPGEGDFAEE